MPYKDPEKRKKMRAEVQRRRNASDRGKAKRVAERHTDHGRSKAAERRRRYKDDPHKHVKYLARMKVARAVKSGKLVRGICETCGVESVQAHHDDYSKPLEVRWLCKDHHSNEINNVGVMA